MTERRVYQIPMPGVKVTECPDLMYQVFQPPKEKSMAKKIESFDIVDREDGKVDFHLVGKNGEIMVQSTQGFSDARDARRGIASVRRGAARAVITDKRAKKG